MDQRLDPRLVRPVGVLTVLASLPITEAGLMALGAFWADGDPLRTFVSAVASGGAILMLVAGLCLIARRSLGRQLALAGAWTSVVACSAGAAIGLVGGHGLLYGVGFPLVIVALLRLPPAGQAERIARTAEPPLHDDAGDVELSIVNV